MTDNTGTLKQKLSQRLTSRQIQLMQLISLPCTELEQRVKEELEVNPALEEGKEPSDEPVTSDQDGDDTAISEADMILGDYADIDDVPDYKLNQVDRSRPPMYEGFYSEELSLQESLSEQLRLTSLDDEQRRIGEFIIGSLDEDGYLRRTSEGLMDDLAIYRGIYVDVEAIEQIADTIRTLDPPGIGARDLRECLSIQLHRREESPAVLLARQIVDDYFDLFGSKAFDKLTTLLEVSDDELRSATHVITHLNPSPGLDFSTKFEETLRTIIPDFYVEESDGHLNISLNRSDIPDVRVNPTFTEKMQRYTGDLRKVVPQERETAKFVKQKIEDARSFVDMIKQRNDTLLSTMRAIVEAQYNYFNTGDIHQLQPMILKDIAERTGYDISTISRVTSTKYVQTDFGIFSLKHFFSESTTNDDGEEVSTRRVKVLLQSIIQEEDKRAPLSDEALSDKLKEEGFNIARRTVAKYRDQLNIPVARLRKEI